MGNERLYRHLRVQGVKVTRAEAAKLRKAWLDTFPEMQQHFESKEQVKIDSFARYTNDEEDDSLEEDNGKRYRVKTITGFIRNRASINAACNTDFQNPVAHVAKEALWNLEEFGLGPRLTNFIHDEVVWWAYPHEVKELVPVVEDLWLEPGRRFFPDVKLKCETSLSLYWDKAGTEWKDVKWAEDGTPILELPKFVKTAKGI